MTYPAMKAATCYACRRAIYWDENNWRWRDVEQTRAAHDSCFDRRNMPTITRDPKQIVDFTEALMRLLQEHGVSDQQVAWELAVDLEPLFNRLILANRGVVTFVLDDEVAEVKGKRR